MWLKIIIEEMTRRREVNPMWDDVETAEIEHHQEWVIRAKEGFPDTPQSVLDGSREDFWRYMEMRLRLDRIRINLEEEREVEKLNIQKCVSKEKLNELYKKMLREEQRSADLCQQNYKLGEEIFGAIDQGRHDAFQTCRYAIADLFFGGIEPVVEEKGGKNIMKETTTDIKMRCSKCHRVTTNLTYMNSTYPEEGLCPECYDKVKPVMTIYNPSYENWETLKEQVKGEIEELETMMQSTMVAEVFDPYMNYRIGAHEKLLRIYRKMQELEVAK